MPEASGWLLLRGSVPAWLLLPSLVLMAVCSPHAGTVAAGTTCAPRCYCSESEGKTVRCSHLHLTHVPAGIPNDTHRLYLDYNQLVSVPTDAFLSLPLLRELDLSHNDLSILEPGAFRGLGPSLKFLDLSSNSLATLNPDAFEGVTARSNLTGNPWHCDCTLQSVLPRLDLEPVSLTGIVCHSAEPADTGAEGQALLLTKDLDLCVVMKKTTDVAMLVTMFGWFSMVISYLVYYVRANQEDARRHLEYLKSLPGLPGKSEESSTISTVV
ncbi:leucine-rich repeat-containing protein 3B [Clupea harengus]|uniref:Leucine-rich repeat-containing protein 3B n=1 Tax=Clupea harengus TaxID=7950 RepID=A0A6P3WAM2_CLUHA|nr:leucine-rich repeat-containing protein 3B [Clupea harengus]